MSNDAITWALAQKVDRSSAKFVLVAMANCAADMVCWPSVPYLVEATCQDRKTVMENMRRLREAGFITPTGEHKGRTHQVTVYRLNSTEIGTLTPTVPKLVPVPKTETNSTVFPVEQSRFSVETGPKTVPGTLKETKEEPKGKPKKAQAPEILDVDPQVLSDWKALRLAKRAPVTETAIAGIRREAGKAGITLQAAMEMSCERGWVGFKADWLRDRGGGAGKQAALEERNAAVIREMFEGAR